MRAKVFNLQTLIFLFIIVSGFFVRMYKIDNPIADWHSWRQADTSSVSRIYLQEGLRVFVPKYHDISSAQTGVDNPEGYRMVEFPIYNTFHFILVKYVGHFSLEMWGRILTALTSIVSSLFLYLFVRNVSNRTIAISAMLFYLFLPFNIYYSRVILPDPMAVMFSLASLYFATICVPSKKIGNLVFSSILIALAILIKPFMILLLPVHFLIIFENFKRKLGLRYVIIFLTLSIAPFILWRIWLSNFPEGIAHWRWMFNGDAIRFRPAFWRWIFGERIGYLILGVWGLIVFGFGFVSRNFNRIFVVYGLSVFIFISIFASANVRHDYYQIYTIPIISILLSLGAIELWNLNSNYHISRYLLVFSLVMMFGMSWYKVREMYRINKPEIIEAGSMVDDLIPINSKVVAPYNKDTAFLYQTKRYGWPFVDGTIPEMIEKGAEYFVSVDTNNLQTKELADNYEVVYESDRFILINLNKMKEK